MRKIIITIKFTNGNGGNVTTQIMGPNTNINYLTSSGQPPRSFDLEPGNYSIILNGASGGTCTLSVDDEFGVNLINHACEPTHIYIPEVFTV